MRPFEFRVDAVFDIECLRWTEYLIGGYFDGVNFEYFYDPIDLFFKIVNTEGHVWAHFGGKYDFIWIVEMAREHGIEVYCPPGAAGSVTTLYIKGGPVLHDSGALLPMPLKRRRRPGQSVAVDLIGEDPYEPGLDCICLKGCGGYCAMGLPKNQVRVREYLEWDCRKLWNVLEAVANDASRHNIQLRNTYASTGWATVRAETGLEPFRWDNPGHFYGVRRALYGGRKEVFMPDVATVRKYDMNAAYPWAMATLRLPVGPMRRLNKNGAAKLYAMGKPGVYDVRVNVPERYIPPLPWRRDDGAVFYPYGEFRGCWTRDELQYAQSWGVEIVKFVSAWAWLEEEPILAPTMERLWSIRAGRGDDLAGRAWARVDKSRMNGVAGKLAQRTTGYSLRVHPDKDKIRFCNKRCAVFGKCRKKCARWISMDRDGWIWQEPTNYIPECAGVHWAVAIYGAVRVELHKGINGIGPVYVNTDEMRVTGERPQIAVGAGLGEWSDEGEYYGWIALGPDHTRCVDENGVQEVRSAGMRSLSEQQWNAYARGEQIELTGGVKSLIESLRSRGPIFQEKSITRRHHRKGARIGGRVFDKVANRTVPVCVEEVMKWRRKQ